MYRKKKIVEVKAEVHLQKNVRGERGNFYYHRDHRAAGKPGATLIGK